jgi:DNA-binding transcriptional ArsR family regulator
MTQLARSVRAFKALAHPVRQRLVAMLRDGPLCVCQMTVAVQLAASTVSAHLAELRRAGLVTENKAGRFVSYRWPQGEPERRLLNDTLERVRRDPQVVADAALVRALRRVGVEELCRVEFDLSRVGIRRPAPATTRARRQEEVS